MRKPKEVVYVHGDLHPLARPWHDDCASSSLMEGPLYRITPEGVEIYGRVGGCITCNVWIAVDSEGNAREVELTFSKERS